MQRKNKAKAALLYQEIDRNPLFKAVVTNPADRSLMNVCFVMAEGYEGLEKEFLQVCKANGMSGLAGHRSVGGFRASIYTAMPKSRVQALVDLMADFARKKQA